jgi:hypothetical protein
MYQHNKLQESANPISDSNGTLPYSSPHIPNEDGSFSYQKSIPEEDSTDYLKSKLWWMGISLMVIGEIGNFVGKWISRMSSLALMFFSTHPPLLAYGFAPASTIAPLGTTTLVSNVILAPLLLKERFRFRDILGVMFAVCGATVVVLSSKREEIKVIVTADRSFGSLQRMHERVDNECRCFLVFQLSPELVVQYLTSMEAIIYYSITGGLILILTALSPRWGSKSILIDLGLVALYGKTKKKKELSLNMYHLSWLSTLSKHCSIQQEPTRSCQRKAYHLYSA